MERILTQEEITELLSAVRQGDIAPEAESAAASPAKATRLDLVRAHAKGQVRLNNLDLVLDSFARNFGITLTNRVQQPLTIKRNQIETVECEQYLQQLPVGSAIGVYKIESLRSGALLVFNPQMTFGVVEILLGGAPDSKPRHPDRQLTSIEMNIIKAAFTDAPLDLSKALGEIEGIRFSFHQLQNNPRLVNLIAPEAMTVVADLDVDINGCKAQMQIVLPITVLDPIREHLQSGRDSIRGSNDAWRKNLVKNLEQVSTDISAQLGTITLEMRDFINFQVGDIIDLPFKPTDTMTVMVAGKPKYTGQAGVRNGNKAVRINGIHHEGANHGHH